MTVRNKPLGTIHDQPDHLQVEQPYSLLKVRRRSHWLPATCSSHPHRSPIPEYVLISPTQSHRARRSPLTVEYAMEAISHAGTVLGILAKDGVVLAAEKRVTGKLLDLSSAKEAGGYGGSGEKMFLLNSYV